MGVNDKVARWLSMQKPERGHAPGKRPSPEHASHLNKFGYLDLSQVCHWIDHGFWAEPVWKVESMAPEKKEE